MARYKVPGVSVAVINDGQIEWVKGSGVLEVGRGTPVGSDTLFQAASISKPVSALAALHLVEQGYLDLDRDVNASLTSWTVPENEYTRDKKVTLRGLLSHTAGLTVHAVSGYAVDSQRPTLLQSLDGLYPARSQPVRVDMTPGCRFRYSGGGYIVLQLLMTDVTGRPFADLMREIVFDPLGMAHSTFEEPAPVCGFASVARGHRANGKMIEGGWEVDPELAVAGLWTTPSDLARFALELQRACVGRSRRVISADLAKEMLAPQIETGRQEKNRFMGLGMFLSDGGDDACFGHSGSNAGYRCLLIASKRGHGVAIMTNADTGNLLIPEIVQSLAQEYGWPVFEPAVRVRAEVDTRIYQTYVGRYQVMPGTTVTVAADGDKLMVQPPRSIQLELHPESETRFFSTEMDITVDFCRDDDGRVVQMLWGEQVAQKIE
jgi:CubicO group peptidase (beta-lactamase class C family)